MAPMLRKFLTYRNGLLNWATWEGTLRFSACYFSTAQAYEGGLVQPAMLLPILAERGWCSGMAFLFLNETIDPDSQLQLHEVDLRAALDISTSRNHTRRMNLLQKRLIFGSPGWLLFEYEDF